MIPRIVLLITALLLASCGSTIVVPQATGGSRSDGTIEMSYEYSWLTNPEPDWTAAQVNAVQGCRNWGYTGADAFGGGVSTCVVADGFGGCNRWRITTTYQCTGQPDN